MLVITRRYHLPKFAKGSQHLHLSRRTWHQGLVFGQLLVPSAVGGLQHHSIQLLYTTVIYHHSIQLVYNRYSTKVRIKTNCYIQFIWHKISENKTQKNKRVGWLPTNFRTCIFPPVLGGLPFFCPVAFFCPVLSGTNPYKNPRFVRESASNPTDYHRKSH